MALDFSSCGDKMNNILKGDIDNDYRKRYGRDSISKLFGGEYYQYSLDGEADGVLVSAGGTASLLDKAFYGTNGYDAITNMASLICSYWDTVVTPGAATVLDVVVSVVPNASSMQSDMESAIHGYITSGDSRNGWPGLIEAIEGVVNQIPFTITELQTSTGVTTTYVSYVE